MFESLNSLNSNLCQLNSILSKSIDVKDKNDSKNNDNNKNENKINEKENYFINEILEFLFQSNMLKDVIQNMKNSIEESFKKNENNLKKDENEKYKEALFNADNILNELNKIHPDKNKIMDSLQILQQISNDIDSALSLNNYKY